MTAKAPMICIFCAKPTRITSGAEICPENPAVAKLPYLRCDGCDASAQIKPGKTATWRLFKSALRIDREKAVTALKRLTIQKAIRRGISDEEALRDGTAWLMEQLGSDADDVMALNQELCRRAVGICNAVKIGKSA